MEEVRTPQIIPHGTFEYIVINHGSQYSLELFMAYDAVILDAIDAQFVLRILKAIRTHNNPDVYLKPVFLLKTQRIEDIAINELVDGLIFSIDQLDLLTDHVKNIQLRKNDFIFLKSVSFEAEIIARIINFMVSRGKTDLIPYPYRDSGVGYFYPDATIHFSHRDEANLIDILNTAENEGLFTSDFEDRVYLCTNCRTGILSYREVCPNCDSSNSISEDLVHHFSCAYVGPISDYQNSIDDNLNCPKCNKTLNHIGVDYDKPSILHTCLKCSHKYQDYHVKAKCLTCYHENDVENLIPKSIRKYHLTKKGQNVPYHGFMNTSKDFNEIPGTVSFDVFKIMLKYEIERLRQNEYTSNIAYVTISNAGEIYSIIGLERQKTLIAELIHILRKNLRSSDFITFYNASTLILSLNEIPTKIANNILNDVNKITTLLLKKNFRKLDIEIETKAVPLNTDLSHEIQVQNLLKQVELNDDEN